MTSSHPKAAYPGLPLIIGCETTAELENMLKAEPRISEFADMYDVHQRKTPEEFLAAAHEFDAYSRDGTTYVKIMKRETPSCRESARGRWWVATSPF